MIDRLRSRARMLLLVAGAMLLAAVLTINVTQPARADLTDYEVIAHTDTVSFLASNSFNGWLAVQCPSGKSVLGGGGYVSEGSTHLRLRVSRPGGTTWWEIAAKDAHASADFNASMTVYAVCATIS